jgi:hypothetical protein
MQKNIFILHKRTYLFYAKEHIYFRIKIMPLIISVWTTSIHFLQTGVENFVGQAQAQGFLNFLNPSPVSDLPSPNL